MKKHLKVISITFIATVGACVPMEQAPLVYSSSNTIGVDVSAGEPESPALNINIGYSSKDKALVPVAVAKVCRASSANHEDCLDSIFKMQVIEGKNSQGDEQKQGRPAYHKERQQRFQNMRDQAEQEQKNLIAVRDEIAELSSLQTQYAGLDDENEAASVSQRNDLKAKIDYLEKLAEDNSDIDARISAKAQLAVQHGTSATEEAVAIKRLEAAGEKLVSDTKTDAFSVYGSFEGAANASKDSAKLNLGKVFSTGVAAQNITQGLARASTASAASDCFAKGMIAAEMLDDAKKKEAISKLFDVCQIQQFNNGEK